MEKQAELTGFRCPQIEHDSAENRPMAMSWMTEELLNKTIQVWSRAYGRIISRDEAMDILRNIKTFYELVSSTEG